MALRNHVVPYAYNLTISPTTDTSVSETVRQIYALLGPAVAQVLCERNDPDEEEDFYLFQLSSLVTDLEVSPCSDDTIDCWLLTGSFDTQVFVKNPSTNRRRRQQRRRVNSISSQEEDAVAAWLMSVIDSVFPTILSQLPSVQQGTDPSTTAPSSMANDRNPNTITANQSQLGNSNETLSTGAVTAGAMSLVVVAIVFVSWSRIRKRSKRAMRFYGNELDSVEDDDNRTTPEDDDEDDTSMTDQDESDGDRKTSQHPTKELSNRAIPTAGKDTVCPEVNSGDGELERSFSLVRSRATAQQPTQRRGPSWQDLQATLQDLGPHPYRSRSGTAATIVVEDTVDL